MKPFQLLSFVLFLSLAADARLQGADRGVLLFNGHSFDGWEGDTNKTWRIEEGALVGGSLETSIPRNEFLCTTRPYTNFVLRLRFRLIGTEGFINAGVQIRSQRVSDPPNEMIGYQADLGEGWYGALYDESRRKKVLVAPDPAAVQRALKLNDWNEYLIRCEGRRIQTWINGIAMIDFEEEDRSLPQFGLIGLQIHGGAKAEVSYKDITVRDLP